MPPQTTFPSISYLRAVCLTLLLLALIPLLTACGDSDTPAHNPGIEPLTEEEAAIAISTQEQRLMGIMAAQKPIPQALITDIEKLVERLPDHPFAYSLLARARLASDQGQRAWDAAQKSLELAPEQTQLRLLAGTIAIEIHRDTQALEYLEAVADELHDDPKAQLFLGTARLRNGLDDLADQAFTNAIRLDPTAHRGHGGRSAIAFRKQDYNAALRHLRKAMDLTDDLEEPEVWRAYTVRKARILRALKRPADAIEALAQLTIEQQTEHEPSTEYALALQDLGRTPEAAVYFEQLAIILPEDPVLKAEAARWNHRAGNDRKARNYLQQAREIDPNNPTLLEVQQEIQTTQP